MGGKVPSEHCPYLKGVSGTIQQRKWQLGTPAHPLLHFVCFKCCWCSMFQILCVINFFCFFGTGLESWVTDLVLAERQRQSFWLLPQYNCSWLLNFRALQQDACCWMLGMLWCWDLVKNSGLTFCLFAVLTLLNLPICVFWLVPNIHTLSQNGLALCACS